MQYEQSLDVDMMYDEGLKCLVQVASTSELFIENNGSPKKEGVKEFNGLLILMHLLDQIGGV
jgi:hypothetical protein